MSGVEVILASSALFGAFIAGGTLLLQVLKYLDKNPHKINVKQVEDHK